MSVQFRRQRVSTDATLARIQVRSVGPSTSSNHLAFKRSVYGSSVAGRATTQRSFHPTAAGKLAGKSRVMQPARVLSGNIFVKPTEDRFWVFSQPVVGGGAVWKRSALLFRNVNPEHFLLHL